MDSINSSDPEALAQEHLAKAINFQKMGMVASAENELNLARQLNPAIVTDPRYKNFHAQKVEQKAEGEAWKFPLYVGAGFLFADALVFVLTGLLQVIAGSFNEYLIWSVFRIGFDIYLAIVLLLRKENARRTAIYWAVFALIIGGIAAISIPSWSDIVLQICYSGAFLLLLLGKPSKIRAGLAIALFVLGYLGMLCGIFIFSFLNTAG